MTAARPHKARAIDEDGAAVTVERDAGANASPIEEVRS